MTTCPVCEEPIPDGGSLCHGDARRLALALRDVPELVRELETTITRRDRVAYRPRPNSRGDIDPVRMPYHAPASDALDALAGSLRSWASNLCEDMGYEAIVGHPNKVAPYLADRMAEIRLRDWGPDMFEEVMGHIRDCQHVIDAPPELVFTGACPTVGPAIAIQNAIDGRDGDACGAELWAPTDAATTRCRNCGTTHDVRELRDTMIRDAAHIKAPAPVIARALTHQGMPLKAERLYTWRRRGMIAPVGVDPKTNQDLYRLGDVQATLERIDRKIPKGIIRKKGKS